MLVVSDRPGALALATRSAFASSRAAPHSSRLDAVELDARRAFARWLRRTGARWETSSSTAPGSIATDVDTLLDLPFPGIDELVGLMEIERSLARRQYRR